jgi:SsrA-binding protein
MKIITKNKAAYSDYEILDTYSVGIVLLWHEVKSIKWSHVNIKDAIVMVVGREIVINNMDVPLYEKTTSKVAGNYQAKWRRVLLVNKLERAKIVSKTTKTWLAIVPLEVFISLNGRIKLKIGIGKLLRKVEKKQILKEKDIKREMDREMKGLR